MAEEFEKKEIAKKSKNFSRWYTDVILKAGLADYSPVKGCMVIRPYGYGLWENIKSALDEMIKSAGIKNAYFPLFIPESFIKKEKEHVEGFSPELAVVTIGGGEKLEEKLVVRPTSETIIYSMFAKWIDSWRSLPLCINQWCNIVRWEKRTYLFLRTTEFLWQEGHTCHATHEEAKKEVDRALMMYAKLYQEWLALPGLMGKKSEAEKFPGAVDTFAYEMLMPDGKVLQGCTSHDLGQNFSKPFKIQFQNKKGKLENVWQTCWGFSTRSIGALIMAHGDDQGLVLPPKIAPNQVVIIPINDKNNEAVFKMASKLKYDLEKAGIRTVLDSREEQTPGWRFNEWELKGVPIQMMVGPKEVQKKIVTLGRRDQQKKWEVDLNKVVAETRKTLEEIQDSILDESRKFLDDNTHEVKDYQEFKKIMTGKKGFIKAFWCEDPKCETKIKEETKATSRLLPLDAKVEKGKCVCCGRSAQHRWFFAQAY
ncbi:MAG TPA: proline--tRNA ligase [Patescibacteria group bacterium]|nr:proline--tRNA ligase [Patescibacteria group bacterium]